MGIEQRSTADGRARREITNNTPPVSELLTATALVAFGEVAGTNLPFQTPLSKRSTQPQT